MAQVNVADPDAPGGVLGGRRSRLEVPAVVGRARDQPGRGADRQPRRQPGGRVGKGLPGSRITGAWTCTLAAVPTVPDWLPGLVTVTVFPGGVPMVLWNCEKKSHVRVLVQVVSPFELGDPSTGSGAWPPSNAAKTTGYPGRHPEKVVTMCVRLPGGGTGGFCGVQPLFFKNTSATTGARLPGSQHDR